MSDSTLKGLPGYFSTGQLIIPQCGMKRLLYNISQIPVFIKPP